MASLSDSQQKGLKSWEKNLQLSFALFMVWLLIVMPASYAVANTYLHLKRMPEEFVIINTMAVILLFTLSFFIRCEKCPCCGYVISGEQRLLFA